MVLRSSALLEASAIWTTFRLRRPTERFCDTALNEVTDVCTARDCTNANSLCQRAKVCRRPRASGLESFGLGGRSVALCPDVSVWGRPADRNRAIEHPHPLRTGRASLTHSGCALLETRRVSKEIQECVLRLADASGYQFRAKTMLAQLQN